MDALHQALFAALDRLSIAGDSNYCQSYVKFVGEVERAFRQESDWMDEVDFPLYREHMEQHARVLSALHHAAPQVMEGNVATGRKITEILLPQWMAFHIATMDMALALAMQLHRPESGFRDLHDPSAHGAPLPH